MFFKSKGIKKFICTFMISIILCTSLISSYSIPKVEAFSMEYSFFYTFVQYMMSSSGLSFSKKQDNEAAARAFSDWCESFPDINSVVGIPSGSSSFIDEFHSAQKVEAGTQFFLKEYPLLIKAWKAFQSRYINSSSANIADSSVWSRDEIVSFLNNYVEDSSIISNLFADGSNYNYLLKRYNYNFVSFCTYYYNNYYYMFIIFKGGYPCSNNSCLIDNNATSSLDYTWIKSTDGTRSSDNSFCLQLSKNQAFGKYTNASVVGSYGSARTFSSLPGAFNLNSTYSAFTEDFYKRVENFHYVDVLDTAVHFKSLEDIRSYADMANISNVYGDYSKTTPIPDTSVTSGSEDIVKAIEDAIAHSDNPSAEDINKIVSDSIASVTGALDDINTSVDENGNLITNQTNVLSDILGQLVSIRSLMNSHYKTDGSSALKEDVDDIAEQFKVVEGGGGSPNDEDPDDEPHVWLGKFTKSVGFLMPLIVYFSEPLIQLTKFQNKISNLLTSFSNLIETIKNNSAAILDAILNLPSNIWNSFKVAFPEGIPIEFPDLSELPMKFHDYFVEHPISWPLELPSWDAVKETILNIPNELQNLANAFKELLDGIHIEFPDSIPLELPDLGLDAIKDLLQDIANSLKKTFVPDFDVIKDTAIDLNSDLNDHFGFNKFKLIFDGFHFNLSSDYPVIKMKTPDILIPFVKSEELVLFNGADFKDYFVFFRSILNACIIITYFYTLLRKFKIHLSM